MVPTLLWTKNRTFHPKSIPPTVIILSSFFLFSFNIQTIRFFLVESKSLVKKSPKLKPAMNGHMTDSRLSMDSGKQENGMTNGHQAMDVTSNSNDEEENNDSTMNNQSSSKVLVNASNTSLNSSSVGKKRGRPRLYSVNPVTGKPIKNRPINPNTPVSVKSEMASTPFTNDATNPINMAPHLANGMAIYPSPSTSTSSYMSSSNTNSNNMFHFNGITGNLMQTNAMTTSTPAPIPFSSNNEHKANEPNDEEMHDENENDDDDDDEDAQTQQEMDNEPSAENKNLDEKENESQMNCSMNNKSKQDSKNESLNKSQSLVLTHFIDGYVIKESSKPFPVKASKDKHSSSSTSHKSPSKFVCVQCGSKKKSISNDKFCSVSCIKRHNKASKSSSKSSKSKSHDKDKPIDDEAQETHEDDDDDTGVRNLRSNKDRLKNIPDQYKTNENNVNTSSSSNSKHKRHKHHHKSKSKHSKSSKSEQDQQPLQQQQQQMDMTQTTPCNSTMIPHNNNHNPHFSPLNTSSIHTHLNMNSSPILNSFNYNNSMQEQYPSGDPTNWNCDEVYQFVNCVAGLQIAELFKSQEVDGSALTLIRDDHLVNTMQIKLGPALKIMSKFNELKTRFYQVNRQQV